MLKLFYFPGSCALASHIVLEEVGARYEAQAVNLKEGEQRTPAYLKINPKGKVPALQTEQGLLTENPAILAYLAQRFAPAELAPFGDAFAFAALQSFNMYLASTVHVAFSRFSRPARFVDGETAFESLKAKALETLHEGFQLIEEQFADGRTHVHGERYTISDPYLLVFERWMSRPGAAGLARYPRVQAHHDRVQARPAVRRALTAEGLT